MFLPTVKHYADGGYAKESLGKSIVTFGGLNCASVPSEGEFSNMQNLSGRKYPCLAPRKGRSRALDDVEEISAFVAMGDVFVWIRGNRLYCDGRDKGSLDPACADTVRQWVLFQDRVLIWPDRMYYDKTDDVLGALELELRQSGLRFVASVLDEERGNAVKYASITGSARFSALRAGDSIEISGCSSVPDNDKYAVVDHLSDDGKRLYFTEHCFLDAEESGVCTIRRAVPDMDHICVANNRVWGCRGTTIYASKLGSAENWFHFAGVSTDSFSVDVASGGDFTGCHAYGSYVVFLKEHFIHKLIGTKPTNFQLSTITCPGLGLQEGSIKSLAYLAGILYFKAPLGIVAFTGGAPSLISEHIQAERYHTAVACTDGRCYYVSMREGAQSSLFVLDSFREQWHREDATCALDFALRGGLVYMLANGKILLLNDAASDEAVVWSGTLGEFCEFSTEKKLPSRLRLRAELPVGSTLTVDYSADGGDWICAWEGAGFLRGSISVSILPTRCDSLRLRLSGLGDCTLYQLERVFSAGSDRW